MGGGYGDARVCAHRDVYIRFFTFFVPFYLLFKSLYLIIEIIVITNKNITENQSVQ